MKIKTHIHEGLLNLFSAKLRSLLALLGILVGTASVVAMVSGGEIATNEALKQFKTLGTDLLSVNISDDADQENNIVDKSAVTLQQANSIISADNMIVNVAPYTLVYNPIEFGGHVINGTVVGVTEEFGHVAHVDISQGRFVSNLDNYQLYCVIGNEIYNNIKSFTFSDPIGQQIKIGKDLFTIIGVAKPWQENSFVYTSIDNSILIPIQASSMLSKFSVINNITFQLKPNADIESVKQNIDKYFKTIAKDKKLFFRSAKEILAKMKKQSEILTVFLGLIGSVSLFVGGIGVMNIMLVSVVERKREIGIRLAVGATPADIRVLFLMEAVMLSLFGGVLGVLIGILIAYLMALFWHWNFTLFLLPPLIGFIVSAATGIFFGFYPARKASKLDPITALRSD